MAKYIAKVTGEFEKRQSVVADTEAEAIEKFKSNLGEDIEDTALSELDVTDIQEVE